MKPPVETVRISSRGREILIKIKRNTGIERWNEICRVALCNSLANKSLPPKNPRGWDTGIEIEWKTFAGDLCDPICSVFALRATADEIDLKNRDKTAAYFRAHMERGIASIQNLKSTSDYLENLLPESQ